ncbi:serine/threonine-protein kinase [Solwaraspora sp. WMMD1047]|uniref:serine/threonine-protein kinase n=1 Tax=Solwaraspora sp. WMMD1047 TaxID=3016102 RepID=UPI0024170776|nr:serine/threonine-protein kinase [Solwaraspora sp. WMMD1047]MDG4829565.1 serine/threonine-protein kinase [Solwaraspora sp. WMMD1047]
MIAPERIGPYRIERLLGYGSFATVWLGHDPTLGARVAIKVLAENWCQDLRVRERFLDEGRLLWRLDHERLVRVHAVGELPDERPYLVMACAEGGSLRDRLATGPIPVAEALRLLAEIAAGVAVLHADGIVHRDLTPGNILFRPDSRPEMPDQVLIADLGLAKALAVASGLTARAGTPGYMAPEQEGPLSTVDARADVFGLGRLGETLLGRSAGDPTEPGVEPAGGFALRDGVPALVARVLRTATARSPADRYPDAAAFAAALARATRAPTRASSFLVRRRGFLFGVLLAAGLAVSAGVAVHRWPDQDSGTVADSTGRITVARPPGWRSAGAGWAGQRGPDGDLEPALLLSPDPDRWADDPAVPGAFVGLSLSLAGSHTPAEYLAEHPHAECAAEPVRNVRLAGVDWLVAAYTGCRGGKPVIVEAVGVGPDRAGLVYAQITPPSDGGAGFVDGFLAGIRVRR